MLSIGQPAQSMTENPMADGVGLVVIDYPDEATAEKAYEVVVQLEHDVVMHESAPTPRTL
jgi:hypothetical protein